MVTGDIEVFMSPIDVTDARAVRAFSGEFEGIDENGDQSPIALGAASPALMASKC